MRVSNKHVRWCINDEGVGCVEHKVSTSVGIPARRQVGGYRGRKRRWSLSGGSNRRPG